MALDEPTNPHRDTIEVAVARIDERTRNMANRMENFVSKSEFQPVKLLVYGLVGAVGTGIVGAMLTLLIARGSVAP